MSDERDNNARELRDLHQKIRSMTNNEMIQETKVQQLEREVKVLEHERSVFQDDLHRSKASQSDFETRLNQTKLDLADMVT